MQDSITAATQARAAKTAYALDSLPEDLGAAYDFQDGFADIVGETQGGVGGFKLAINSPPQLAHFGVSDPVCARIFGDEVHASGVQLPRSSFQALSIEPEIAAVLSVGVETLQAPVTREQALSLIEAFRPAIELIDTRGNVVPQMTLGHVVALNVFNAGIVLGETTVASQDLSLSDMHVTVDDDGQRMGETTGTAPQDPVEAVMWLINHQIARGVALQAGQIIMCGTHLPIRTLAPDVQEVRVSMSGLGNVAFTLG